MSEKHDAAPADSNPALQSLSTEDEVVNDKSNGVHSDGTQMHSQRSVRANADTVVARDVSSCQIHLYFWLNCWSKCFNRM